MSSDRITVLLRDDNGGVIGRAVVPAVMLAVPGQRVDVSVPWWAGSERRYVVELRRELEPATFVADAGQGDPDTGPELVDQADAEAGAVDYAAIVAQEDAEEAPSAAAAAAVDEPAPDPVVSITVLVPGTGERIHLREPATAGHRDEGTPRRTVGEIATELAERLGLAEPGSGNVWSVDTVPATGAFAPSLCLTPRAEGMTFALVPYAAPVQTGK
jgi:hypothetical protein